MRLYDTDRRRFLSHLLVLRAERAELSLHKLQDDLSLKILKLQFGSDLDEVNKLPERWFKSSQGYSAYAEVVDKDKKIRRLRCSIPVRFQMNLPARLDVYPEVVVDEESPLGKQLLQYKKELDEHHKHRETFKRIVARHLDLCATYEQVVGMFPATAQFAEEMKAQKSRPRTAQTTPKEPKIDSSEKQWFMENYKWLVGEPSSD